MFSITDESSDARLFLTLRSKVVMPTYLLTVRLKVEMPTFLTVHLRDVMPTYF